MNRFLPALVMAWLLPTFLMAEEGTQLVMEYSWRELSEADQLLTGTVVKDEIAGLVLKVEKQGGESVMTLLEIDNPPITSPVYRIEGRMRYEGVSEQGYLETWNHFPDGNAYFSRTLGMSGPMKALSWESGWRDFMVPFSFEGATNSERPNRIQFNVVLPKNGTVWLSDVSIRQFPSIESATISREAWWDRRTSGWVGAVMGSSLGMLGALIGILAGLGRARRFTLSVQVLGIIAGVVSLITGVVALLLGQPYAVYYPLLLCGVVGTVVLGSLLPVLSRRYSEHELRRMQSVDA